MYLLGYDIGSSSIKASIIDSGTGLLVASATSPDTELPINAPKPGWAEQHPETWWEHVKLATASILSKHDIDARDIGAIGISYQMHGLVLVDERQKILRPSIIWCDSRAVDIGERAFSSIGDKTCLTHLLNSPGNFTASKLRWVKENEPDIYCRIDKFMLPGEYVAMKLSGRIVTTPSGLSEGIFWDFKKQGIADLVLDEYGIDPALIPEVLPTFSIQGDLTIDAASELGLRAGTPISYRAGDQPNNALSLNVLNPGEIAATAGTSGVVYGVTDQANNDPQSRVNTFVHVTHRPDAQRFGILLCINGTGILNSWLKHNVMGKGEDYEQMNSIAEAVPPGAGGLTIIPFGNGAERSLENRDIGASVHGLQLTTHHRGHLLRAAQEGIVFALRYGVDIIRDMGVSITSVRAGNANMFLSPLFRKAFATVTGAVVELYNTDGSQGAARGAGIGAGIFPDEASAFAGLTAQQTIEPTAGNMAPYEEAYGRWCDILETMMNDTR